MSGVDAKLPWRGPGPGRPDLPLPPEAMPLLRNGRLRKRWHYAAAYEERLMVCAATVEIGPLGQSFWALWDRKGKTRHAHTSFLRGRNDVKLNGGTLRLDAGRVSANLRFAESAEIESVCPSGERGFGWTRKRAGMPVEGTVTAGDERWTLRDARGVDDESAGYHQRHTDWFWSAGVGRAVDGRAVAWNLVTGINDPARGSERAIWIDGETSEPDQVAFDGLVGIGFADGSRMDFEPESERARSDNFLIIRSRYKHVFGTFSGSLAGIELESALGVMEEHSAVW